MKLIQFFLPGKGKRVGVVQGDRVLDITSIEEGVRSTLDLVQQGKTAQGIVARATWLTRKLHRKGLEWRELQCPPSRRSPHLLIPIEPPEIWGARGADAVSSKSGNTPPPPAGTRVTTPGADLPASPRPGLFFKGTAHRAVGPESPLRLRGDSSLTIPDAGLSVILGAEAAIAGFTAGNDVTAGDIERSGPQFLSQAKVYAGSYALGPCLVTSDEIGDPRRLQARCSIHRGGAALFSEVTNTAGLRDPVEATVAWLVRDNPVPPGSALSLGLGILVPDSAALRPGDRVEIELEGIGRLGNPVEAAAPRRDGRVSSEGAGAAGGH